MKRLPLIAFATLFITLSAKGQNLFFIGEQSYTSTQTYTLESNHYSASNLDVLFAKDGNRALFAISTNTSYELLISGKLIIYLDDGTVITLKDKGTDYVDKTAKAMYYLSDEELNIIKNSNINTIRYKLERREGIDVGGNFTASNKGDTIINFPALVTDFFEENKTTKSDSNKTYIIRNEKNSDKVLIAEKKPSSETERSAAPYELNWEGDLERAPIVQPLPENTSDTEATITIKFEVKPTGTIGRIISLKKMNPELEREVTRTLRSWRFSRLPSGVPQQSQWGTITFRFVSEKF